MTDPVSLARVFSLFGRTSRFRASLGLALFPAAALTKKKEAAVATFVSWSGAVLARTELPPAGPTSIANLANAALPATGVVVFQEDGNRPVDPAETVSGSATFKTAALPLTMWDCLRRLEACADDKHQDVTMFWLLDWMGCQWDVWSSREHEPKRFPASTMKAVFSAFASRGRADLIDRFRAWLHQQGPKHARVDFDWLLAPAASNGHVGVLEWAVQHCAPPLEPSWNTHAISAAEGGHRDAVLFILKRTDLSYLVACQICAARGAVTGDRLELLRWLVEEGVRGDMDFTGAMRVALETPNRARCAKYLASQGVPYPANATRLLAQGGNIELALELVRERLVGWSRFAVRNARDYGHDEFAELALAHGAPPSPQE